MTCTEVRMRIDADWMIRVFGFQAEGQCNYQARLAEKAGDKSSAIDWRKMAQACRQHMGEEPSNFRFRGRLF